MIDKSFVCIGGLGCPLCQRSDLFFGELGEVGWFMAEMIKPGYPEQMFEVFGVIIPVISRFAFGGDELVPLFPNAESMCLDPAQVFYVTDGEAVHRP